MEDLPLIELPEYSVESSTISQYWVICFVSTTEFCTVPGRWGKPTFRVEAIPRSFYSFLSGSLPLPFKLAFYK